MNISASQHQVSISYTILAIALCAVVFAALATPIRERAAFSSNLELQRATYAESLEALARSEAVNEELALRRAASDSTSQIFHADTAALAGAELQNQLDGLITREGGKLLSSAFRDVAVDTPLTPLSVTVRVRCSLETLLRVLHGLENRSPLLLVESLSIQARQRGSRSPRQDDADLDVELEVVGFLGSSVAP